MSEKNVYVATYGSLRRKMGNHSVNAMAGGEFVGLGKTEQNINLYAYCSGFPSVSLAHSSNEKPVVVDVYHTTQSGLEGPYDRLEGYNEKDPKRGFYDRTLVKINMDDGRELDAWIYHIDEETGPLVESGDWAIHRAGEKYYDGLAT
ncbi:MAG: gamma-glutamylcyclotransferase family protein [Phocaeicola sp.]